jgi:hypothetical protein
VSYVERVNCELSELLERCDADALAAQGALEADKRALSRHTASLQAEVRPAHCLPACLPALVPIGGHPFHDCLVIGR